MTESEQTRAAKAAMETAMQERERAMKERERRYANRKRRSNFNGERRVPGYQIWVVSSRGAKRHGFVVDPFWDEPGEPHWRWYTEKPPKRGASMLQRGERWLGTDSRPLPDVIDLAKGVDVSRGTLEVVFDALVSAERHRIDVADLKRVVSQLGSRIRQLNNLSGEQRRLAEPALYTEILARCSSM